MTAVAYVDTSALVKLIVEEVGSLGMARWYVGADRLLISRLGIVETHRAAARRTNIDMIRLDRILNSIEVFELDDQIGREAAAVGPVALRSLDAIHLATAMSLRPAIDAFVTYDDRLASAARELGLPVVSPA
ncbi:MAG: type II toxin-antitoxin system VapC family toxin [Chloroflexi bacterium]|nr:type II toxin-antitoxin system VapC family toxin [Chloroflexota bacterium]